MFKRINKHALREAVHSEEAMAKEIKECLQYRKAYGFLITLMAVVIFLTVCFGGKSTQPHLLLLGFLFITTSISSASNNSRLELLEAVTELKRLPQFKN